MIATISADLTSSASSDAALVLAMERNGGNAPDHVFLCAGFSRPKFFVDTSSEELQSVCCSHHAMTEKEDDWLRDSTGRFGSQLGQHTSVHLLLPSPEICRLL